VTAGWRWNSTINSYWLASIGPFEEGESVRYTPHVTDHVRQAGGATYEFAVGPKIYISLMWHHHQPQYRLLDPRSSAKPEQCRWPWVRLHALRDYYSMAALIAERPALHATFNLTPSLLGQLEGYVSGGATDRALELTLRDAESLSETERREVLATFFDADWHHQIFPHQRYRELFERRTRGEPFAIRDLRDLQMWFSLAWFGEEFRTSEVLLATGELCSVRRFVEQQCGFSASDIADMVVEQRRVLSAVIPLHRLLQDRGQVELSTSPYYHPILPLLIDTDDASLDRADGTLPDRFAWPEDAAAQVDQACRAYRGWFGRDPRGMWPAEGAVSQRSVPIYCSGSFSWIASDRGVLARSGRWGYETSRPDVSCQARRASQGDAQIAVFFRDTELSDAIGFRYASYAAPELAVADFIDQVRRRFIAAFDGEGDRILTVILDGENAWGSYAGDGRAFLRALYQKLDELRAEIRTVTFAEWLLGNPSRGVRAHPMDTLEGVHDLFTGSWIDEVGSAPGVDLGTWIGEPEENRAWRLLGRTRSWLAERGAAAATSPQALASVYAAEGSDWFWWYGADQDSGQDEAFDQLFREHLASAYRAMGAEPPTALAEAIVHPGVLWTFVEPVHRVPRERRLVFRTICPAPCAGPWMTALKASGPSS
jgi:alpha-amylase/alpha-mannosidase (GH57 family)